MPKRPKFSSEGPKATFAAADENNERLDKILAELQRTNALLERLLAANSGEGG